MSFFQKLSSREGLVFPVFLEFVIRLNVHYQSLQKRETRERKPWKEFYCGVCVIGTGNEWKGGLRRDKGEEEEIVDETENGLIFFLLFIKGLIFSLPRRSAPASRSLKSVITKKLCIRSGTKSKKRIENGVIGSSLG